MQIYPLQFEDNFHEAVWGGKDLQLYLGKNLPAGKKIGESWELSCHPHGEGVVRNGPLKGKLLSQLMKSAPDQLVGKELALRIDAFPLLIKLIDASDTLSIQVHPGDEYAAANAADKGKTEAWQVLRAKPGADILCGLNRKLTKGLAAQAIKDHSFVNYLQSIKVKGGESIFVPAGSVHAIKAKVLLYEVQEASDVTYRIYDWGRTGLDGRPRALAIKEALDVMDYSDTGNHQTIPAVINSGGFTRTICVACKYFAIEKYDISVAANIPTLGSFHAVTVIAGLGTLSSSGGALPCSLGSTTLVPAVEESYTLSAKTPMTALVARVPKSVGSYIDELYSAGITGQQIQKLGGLIQQV